MEYTKRLLEEVGIEPERLEMFNMSASMGPKFAETADEMTERVRTLGPSPLRNCSHTENVEAAVTDQDKGEKT
ncbi:MAG: hypothetical protein Kow0099_29630 [Candidatus Abyssubacteria bacterium]